MSEELPPRIKRLKDDVVAAIPCEREELRLQLSKSALPAVLNYYMTWADRLIPPRPRVVTVGPSFWSRGLDLDRAAAIANIANISNLGGDLGPYLSGAIMRRGFTGHNRGDKRWVVRDDGHKDFALHAYDLHHLHLSAANSRGKRRGNSNELLFARITRSEFHAVFLGDHKSFDSEELARVVAKNRAASGHIIAGIAPGRDEVPAKERIAMRRIGAYTTETVDGSVVYMPPLSSDGSSLDHGMHVRRILRGLQHWESLLDTREGIKQIARGTGLDESQFTDVRWGFHYGDFCLEANPAASILFLPWRR